MPSRKLPAVVAALTLSACAHAPSAPRTAQETPAMTQDAAAPSSFSPRLDAGQALSRLLALIRGSRTVQDITPSRLQETFGVPFGEQGGRLAYAEQLTPEWWASYEWDPARAQGAQFEFAFRPGNPDADPDYTGICTMDYDAFAAELKAQGFGHQTYRGEHGRAIEERFERAGMRVAVQTRGEAGTTPESIKHACVQMVHVR